MMNLRIISGKIGGKSSKTKRIILEKNKIRYRYYAMDKEQKSLNTNAEMASLAILDALARNGNVADEEIGFLATSTTSADLLLPGFASMVNAETGLPVMKIASHSGLCASGMHALKNAYLHIKSNEHHVAISCASEFLSREFKHTKYEAQSKSGNIRVPFDTDFLRFMLSDGAGAAILQNTPSKAGLSLRIELVNEITTVGVNRFLELVEEGLIDPKAIDWMVCHYSSHFFIGRNIPAARSGGGVTIPD